MRTLLSGLLGALLICCAPGGQAPFRVMALVLGSEGVYETRPVELHTVSDVVALKGSVAQMVGGARVLVDPNDPLLQTNGGNLTDAQLAEVFLKGKGVDVRASYIEKDGVLWPADFHTWNMVTTYFNFEQAFGYFQQIYDGKPTEELLGSKVLYFAEFTLTEVSPQPQKDNALFFSPVWAFAVLPFESLQQIPLSINIGVIGHEYSHRVFNTKVYGGRAIPDPFLRWLGLGAANPQVNLLKALDEGLADFHAHGVTCVTELGCNPRFFSHSFKDDIVDDRDISKPDKCMSEGLRTALASLPVGTFTGQGLEYEVGTLLAASLYQAGNKSAQMGVLQKAVISAYDDDSAATPGFRQLIRNNLETPQNFTLSAVLDALLAHLPAGSRLQELTCNEFLDRFQVPRGELPHCPVSSVKGTDCPLLP
ncbi:MAG: hypothetical protein ACOZIN_16235 [Myxococcota bacterium]